MAMSYAFFSGNHLQLEGKIAFKAWESYRRFLVQLRIKIVRFPLAALG